MKSKKGSLSLSVNAIVVLIIAITMLGLGLGFVRMIFGGAVSKMDSLISDEPDPANPGAANPVSLSRGLVIAGPGDDQAIKIALYNPTNDDWDSVKPAITCGTFVTETNAKKIPAGRYATFGALIKIPSNEPEGSHLCEVSFINTEGAVDTTLDHSTDFTLKVQHG
ncbi:MAG: hypothetical protein ABIJ08_01130 [Nanoarchaeota archaeon]